MNEVQRVCSVNDLPCQNCGQRQGDHYSESKCPEGGTCFQHAETPACEPGAGIGSEIVGHLFRGYDRHLYRAARMVTFPQLKGDFDVMIELFERDVSDDVGSEPLARQLISSRAINRSFHHSQRCSCGCGYWR